MLDTELWTGGQTPADILVSNAAVTYFTRVEDFTPKRFGLMFDASSVRASFIRSNQVRPLMVTSPQRVPAFPDVPTVSESGGPSGYEVTGWTLVAAPKGLPKAVADKIQRDIEAALAEPDIKDRYAAFGYETFPTTREQFAAFIQAESAKWAGVIQRAKVSLD